MCVCVFFLRGRRSNEMKEGMKCQEGRGVKGDENMMYRSTCSFHQNQLVFSHLTASAQDQRRAGWQWLLRWP
jgi:hypothetical protein